MNINNFVIEIKPYTHLADEPQCTNLEKLMNECGTLFGEEAEVKTEVKTIGITNFESVAGAQLLS
ncbi:MAG: hypothetical protein OIN90_08525 [Candidatus Methanoperedens sp.]|nr:hypothetical protein [Candidatus Methanoperedens sp.]